MMTGRVVSLHLLSEHGARPRPVTEARAILDHGLDGDLHGKTKPSSRRQVLILDRTTLDAMGLRPGDLREQITVDFPPLMTLPPATQLRIGEVTCELTGPCDPCTHIGALNGVPDPAAFQRALDGRRGQTAKVVGVEGRGLIRVGDPVVMLIPSPR